jgi:phage terminase large subunit GpA-like protein
VPQKTSRGIEYKWVNTKRARNEVLDCSVYAIFVTHALGLHTYTSAMWDKLEDAVQPRSGDLFASPVTNSDTNTQTPDKFSDSDQAANTPPNAIQTKPANPLMRRPSRQTGPARTW